MLTAAQQLPPFDRRRLDEHLSTCAACSEFYRNITALAGALATFEEGAALPATNPSDATHPHLIAVPSEDVISIAARTQDRSIPSSDRSSSLGTFWLIAASLAFFAAGLEVSNFLRHPAPLAALHVSANSKPTIPASAAAPQPMLSSPARKQAPVPDDALQAKLSLLETRYQAVQTELAALREQADKNSAALQEREAQIARLTQENSEQGAVILQTRLDLEQLRSAHTQDARLIAARDTQIRQLMAGAPSGGTAEPKVEDTSSLMAQRNLHVVDVYDNDAKGQRTPAFGRVFYSEGGPMLFVAFDLPTHGSEKLTYHAWGRMEGASRKPVQLGTFAQDDAKAQRWVMSVNDPKLLKQIDAVFITADRRLDAQAPGSAPLLYAYLRQLPNHP